MNKIEFKLPDGRSIEITVEEWPGRYEKEVITEVSVEAFSPWGTSHAMELIVPWTGGGMPTKVVEKEYAREEWE